jgi:hypothetical protein
VDRGNGLLRGWSCLTVIFNHSEPSKPLPSLKAHVAKMKFPYIIEFAHFNDRLRSEVVNRFLSDYRYSQIGVIDDPLKYISPSTRLDQLNLWR